MTHGGILRAKSRRKIDYIESAKKSNVIIYRLITESTIEEKVQELKNKKTDISMQLLEGHEVPSMLTRENMENLIFE